MATVNAVRTPAAPTAQAMPTMALASPYDGSTPMAGMPIMGPSQGGMVPQLTGLSGGRPQVNATNQTAIAPNGNVNQVVTNENQYTNKYYNIIVPNQGGLFGGIGGVGGLGGWNTPGNSFVDPKTGVLYVQQETGILGWLKRLVRGY